MKPEEIRKLLGGFATGTLTERERALLFSAALEDQTLFDALANEEALREMLADPATREELLQDLRARPAEQPAAVPRDSGGVWAALWERMTPGRLALAGALAAVVLAIGVVQYARLNEPEAFTEIALNRAPEPAAPGTAENAAQPQPQAMPAPAPKAAPRDALRRQGQFADERSAARAAKENVAPALEKRERDAAAPREDSGRVASDQLAASSVAQPAAPSFRAAAPSPPPPSAPASTRSSAPVAAEERESNKAAVAEKIEAPRAGIAGQVGRGFGGGIGAGVATSLPQALGGLAVVNGEFTARVTDVNGTIVSINAGAGAGVRVGDAFEIVRENRVLGVIRISEAREAFAVGAFEPTRSNRQAAQSAGGRLDTTDVNAAVPADRPRAGDAVRRSSASPAR